MKPVVYRFADYFEALARLKAGRPVRVSKGTKITKDSVGMEAGRGKGSIKKSRPAFRELIDAIETAGLAQANDSSGQLQDERLEKVKTSAHRYRSDLDAAISSLVSRMFEVYELKKKVCTLEEKVEQLTEQLSKVSNTRLLSIKPKNT